MLKDLPQSTPPPRETRLNEILASYLDAVDAGDAPSRTTLISRHPDLAGDLEEFFAGQDQVDSLARPALPSKPLIPALEKNRILGDYEIVEEIARGGMGVVYKARQLSLNRIVALKMVLLGKLASRADVERFRREAEAVASLDHPNIVPIYEIGEQDGLHYYSMKFVSGGNLSECHARFSEDPRAAASMLETTARAVEYAHQRGVLHRDLKPANILVGENGEPLVSDFGLARRLEAAESALTQTGEVLGTPNYLAPEQASGGGKRATAAADVYSLGAILYELLTGQRPFEASTPLDTLRRVKEEEPRPPRTINQKVPLDLETICLKCLEKAPLKRYPSAGAFALDLRRYLAGQPVLARRITRLERTWRWCRRNPAPTAVAVLLLAVAVGAIASALRLEKERGRTLRNLWDSRLLQAQAGALSHRPGQRGEGLEALTEAAKIRPSIEVRNAAIACIVLTDIEVAKKWEGYPAGTAVLAFDHPMTRYARGDRSGDISLREVEGDRQFALLPGGGEPATLLRFSADGRLLAARYREMDETGDLCVWDCARSIPIWSIPSAIVQWGVDFSPDSRSLACSFPDETIRLLEAATGKESRRLHPGCVAKEVVIDPTGKRIALAATGGGVKVLDLESSAVIFEQSGYGISWHPGGDLLAVASDSDFAIWNVASRKLIKTFSGHETGGIDTVFSPAGDLIASRSWDSTVRLWNLAGTELLRHQGDANMFRMSSDGRMLGYSLTGETIGLWKLVNGGELKTLGGSVRDISRLDIHPDGRLLASADLDGVKLWDLSRAREVAFIPLGFTGSAIFHPLQGYLMTSGEVGLFRWPWRRAVEEGTEVLRLGPPERISRAIGRDGRGLEVASLSADGRYLAVRDSNKSAALLDLESPSAVVSRFAHPQLVWLAVSPRGQWVATAAQDGREIAVWSGHEGTRASGFSAEGPYMNAHLLFSPDGKRLFAGTTDAHCVWEVGSWKLERRIPRLDSGISPGAVALTRDGAVLAIARTLREIQLIDCGTGLELATLKSPDSRMLVDMCFSPDGSQLVTSHFNFAIQLWDFRRIRQQLASMGLDWERPPFSGPPGSSAPLRVEVDLGELGASSNRR